MRKAQLTIEYMIVLVIMMLLFNGITLDLVNMAVADANSLQLSEMVNSSRMALADAAKIVGLQGSGAKKTVLLRAPPDCALSSADNVVYLMCEPGSVSYDLGFNLAALNSPSASVKFLIDGGTIESGEIGAVSVTKS